MGGVILSTCLGLMAGCKKAGEEPQVPEEPQEPELVLSDIKIQIEIGKMYVAALMDEQTGQMDTLSMVGIRTIVSNDDSYVILLADSSRVAQLRAETKSEMAMMDTLVRVTKTEMPRDAMTIRRGGVDTELAAHIEAGAHWMVLAAGYNAEGQVNSEPVAVALVYTPIVPKEEDDDML